MTVSNTLDENLNLKGTNPFLGISNRWVIYLVNF